MSSIVKLQRLIGRSASPPARPDWTAIEASVGLSFPADYKELCSAYHALEFSDFLLVRHIPSIWAAGMEQDVVHEVLAYLGAITDGEDDIIVEGDAGEVSFEPPFRYHPEVGGLYPWASTANGDECLWVTDPAGWTVVITNGNSWWRYRGGGVVNFLCDLASGELACPLFPDLTASSPRALEVLGPGQNFHRRPLLPM